MELKQQYLCHRCHSRVGDMKSSKSKTTQYWMCRECNRERCAKYYHESPHGKERIRAANKKWEQKMKHGGTNTKSA